MRLFLAALVAPLGTIAAVFLLMIAAWLLGIGEIRNYSLLKLSGVAAYLSTFAIIVAYIVMATIGSIAVWLSHRAGWLSAKHYALLGFAVGALPFVGYFGYATIADGLRINGVDWNIIRETVIADGPQGAAWVLLGAVSGMFSALLFWRLTWGSRAFRQSRLKQPG